MIRKPPKQEDINAFIQGTKIEPSQEKDKTFLLYIPFNLHKDAKRQALNENMTLQDFLIEAIRDKLR